LNNEIGESKAKKVALALNVKLQGEERSNPELYIKSEHVRAEYANTKDNQQLLRALVLRPSFLFLHASEYQLNLLRKYKVPDQLYVDGTFRIVPEGITQLVNIRMRQHKENSSKLVATALLKTKTTMDYRRLWMELAVHVKCLRESKIIINLDFEIAHHKAVQEELGDKAIVVGCMFHLVQSVHKWLKRKGDSYFLNQRKFK